MSAAREHARGDSTRGKLTLAQIGERFVTDAFGSKTFSQAHKKQRRKIWLSAIENSSALEPWEPLPEWVDARTLQWVADQLDPTSRKLHRMADEGVAFDWGDRQFVRFMVVWLVSPVVFRLRMAVARIERKRNGGR